MFILIVGVAHTKAFMLDLTTSAASKRHKGRLATYPLLTTWGFHQWRLGIATEPAMLAGNRLGFHAIVRHRMAFSGGASSSIVLACGVHHTANRSILCDHLHRNPRRPPWPEAMRVNTST